ncbi:MAG: histidinol-phosphate transaminase [Planctomycetota bacterium]|nr:histidinol-phosphate transaminase [Planctomycetota bacterium]
MDRSESNSSYLRPHIQDLVGYVPGTQPEGYGALRLNTNENPYPPSVKVRVALSQILAEDLRFYPDSKATRLRMKIAQNLGVDLQGVVVGNGSDEILRLLIQAVVEPGQSVVYPGPTYTLYEVMTRLHGAIPEQVAFHSDWSIPESLYGHSAPLVILCNPNSPSGTWVELESIERLASSLQGVLVIDEAYADFAGETASSLVSTLPNLVVVRTFSKSYSLAGMRVGYAVASPEVSQGLKKICDSYNCGTISLLLAEAALDHQEAMLANVDRIVQSREHLTKYLELMGFQVPPSRANFVLARSTTERARLLFEGLVRAGVFVRYFDQPGLDDSLRITVGTSEQNSRLLGVMKPLMEKLI